MNGENVLKRGGQILGVIAGGTIVLYILGFIIVETFIFSMKLEGIFWLSDEFYARAGGRFILDAGFHVRRDNRRSIAYSEELIFSMSVPLQSTDRHHGIVG